MRPLSIRAVGGALVGLILSTLLSGQSSYFIPSNTPTVGTCNVAPFGRISSIHQSIASAAELGNTAAGQITDLAFAACHNAVITFDTIEIVMAQTTATTLSTTFASNLVTNPRTVLKATNYVWPVTANQWNRIGLDSPYLYLASQGSLVVQIILTGTKGGTSMHRDTGQRVYVMDWTGAPPATGTSHASMLKWEVVFSGSDASVFGTGCQGSNSMTPTLAFTGTAKSGTTLGVDLGNALPNAPTFLAVDLKRTEPALDLGIVGAPGCRMHVFNLITLGGVCNGAGNFAIKLPIPASTPPGIHVYLQFFPVDQPANALGLTASNYGRVLSGL